MAITIKKKKKLLYLTGGFDVLLFSWIISWRKTTLLCS